MYPLPLRIVFLVDTNVNLLNLSAPLQAFMTANKVAGGSQNNYQTMVVSADGGLVRSSCGVGLETLPFTALDGLKIDTILVPGGESDCASGPAKTIALVSRLAPHVKRICALSSGVFLLASAGQLVNRPAAVHWNSSPLLRKRHPSTLFDPDRIFLRDGAIWTAAGQAASMDMTLALIEQDFGYSVAIKVARDLVMFIKRPGSQSQLSVSLELQSSEDSGFAELHAWIADHLAEELTVARLAERAGLSMRTFARSYARRVGRTPAKTVEAMRVEAACRALENTSSPVKSIAAKVGLVSESSMQRLFRRVMGVTPTQFRQVTAAGIASQWLNDAARPSRAPDRHRVAGQYQEEVGELIIS